MEKALHEMEKALALGPLCELTCAGTPEFAPLNIRRFSYQSPEKYTLTQVEVSCKPFETLSGKHVLRVGGWGSGITPEDWETIEVVQETRLMLDIIMAAFGDDQSTEVEFVLQIDGDKCTGANYTCAVPYIITQVHEAASAHNITASITDVIIFKLTSQKKSLEYEKPDVVVTNWGEMLQDCGAYVHLILLTTEESLKENKDVRYTAGARVCEAMQPHCASIFYLMFGGGNVLKQELKRMEELNCLPRKLLLCNMPRKQGSEFSEVSTSCEAVEVVSAAAKLVDESRKSNVPKN